jgi:hypothetical protein
MFDEKQFYPTPYSLAVKACAKFKNKDITRLLEPSAGRSDLVKPFLDKAYFRTDLIDCIEIDLNNQSVLRGKGLNVIDGDFMQFSGLGSMYSHVLMNPCFKNGVDHVIKAFGLLHHGELVAILNAETIKNPCTDKRKLLVEWVGQYGDVEFLQEAFTDPDTLRKTSVEIALIYLEKKTDFKQNFTHGLEIDKARGVEHTDKQELAIRGSTISNAVAVFNAAAASLRDAEIAMEEAIYYRELLGSPLNNMIAGVSPGELQKRYNDGYAQLKERAWNNILTSTEFSRYLSAKAFKSLVRDFKEVSRLSFTESNIRGFLLGLIEKQPSLNIDMTMECFDMISRYSPGNKAYYRSWKSNAKHRSQAFRVKMSRFIIPTYESHSFCLRYETSQQLCDMDKAFALLAGDYAPQVSLKYLFDTCFDALKSGERLSSSYFDVRYYHKMGSIHFYPTRKDLIDRLNRTVGRTRKWLPQENEIAPASFWNQYEQAEKVTEVMVFPVTRYGNEVQPEEFEQAHLKACEKLSIDISNLLTHDEAVAA